MHTPILTCACTHPYSHAHAHTHAQAHVGGCAGRSRSQAAGVRACAPGTRSALHGSVARGEVQGEAHDRRRRAAPRRQLGGAAF
eukprot:365988-Chlamydomonas_euryale.AAC.13